MAGAVALHLLLYSLLWAGFGAGHSALAAPAGRRLLVRIAGAADRLAYNAIALAHLAIVLGIGRFLFAGTEFAVPGWVHGTGLAVAACGAAVLAIAGRSYDLGRFAGWAQFRAGVAEAKGATEPLATGGLNAVVRHPLYLGLLLVLWGGATSPFRLATAIAATAYILVGIRFEERNLVRIYGDAYHAYRARVPMLVPRPTRR